MAQQLPKPDVERIRRTNPDVVRLRAGSILWRIHETAGPHPVRWDEVRRVPGGGRFDPHEEGAGPRGILYASLQDPSGAFAEVFQGTRVIDLRSPNPRGRRLAGFKTAAGLRLLDLRGTWPLRAGGNQAINSGSRARSRAWSRAIYEAYPGLAGIAYPSSLGGRRWTCLALFDRACRVFPAHPALNLSLDDQAILGLALRAAQDTGYLVER